MGQDHNQLRHHIRKKHGTSKYRIIDVSRILAENDESGMYSLDRDCSYEKERQICFRFHWVFPEFNLMVFACRVVAVFPVSFEFWK